jgi:ABC-type uncharacterized transport system ATPase subunit
LKLYLTERQPETVQIFSGKLAQRFPSDHPITVEEKEEGWFSLTVNQDEIQLLDVLSFAMGELPIKDVMIEEIHTENVIKKIYEGALLA